MIYEAIILLFVILCCYGKCMVMQFYILRHVIHLHAMLFPVILSSVCYSHQCVSCLINVMRLKVIMFGLLRGAILCIFIFDALCFLVLSFVSLCVVG